MPKISVLMPVFNTPETFLREAMESVLKQTFHDFEFIIFNDGSTDPRVEKVVRSYSDSRIRYIANAKNLGIADAHNELIQAARGEYLAMMDHDDIALPRRLETQFEFMRHHPEVGLCGTGFRRFGMMFKKKTILYPSDHDSIMALMFFKCPMHHPSVMVRHSVLDKYSIRYDSAFVSVNDRKLFFDVGRHVRLANIPEALSLYRIHNRMTSRMKGHLVRQEQKTFRSLYAEFLGISFDREECDVIDEYLVRGRNTIYSAEILNRIEQVLLRLADANEEKKFVCPEKFREICSAYLIKRCFQAAVRARVSSRELLKYSRLAAGPLHVPLSLRILNKLCEVR